jgi:hypothetical protein
MTEFPLEGGCHCGSVRYIVRAAPLSVQHCHCSRCRKVYGQLTAQGAVIRRDDLHIVKGEPNLTTYFSSPSFGSRFCRTCGCHLFAFEDSETDLMYFAPATLDGGVHPGHPAGKECHIHVGSKAEWDRFADDLPKYNNESPDEIISGIQRDEIAARTGGR